MTFRAKDSLDTTRHLAGLYFLSQVTGGVFQSFSDCFRMRDDLVFKMREQFPAERIDMKMNPRRSGYKYDSTDNFPMH